MSDEATVVNVTDPNNVQAAPIEKPDKPRDDSGKFTPKDQRAQEPEQRQEETSEPNEAGQQEKKPNKTGEFIDRLKNENREARRKLEEYERRMAALEARLPKEPEPAAPDPNSFYNDPLAYVNQSSQYAVMQARQQWEQEQAALRAKEEHERTAATFREKSEAFKAAHPDFEDVIFSVPEDLLPEQLAGTIIAHERGPELAYHLGTNLGELARLASTPAQYQHYLLNEIVSRMDTRTTAPQPEVPHPAAVSPAKQATRAPAPVTTLSGSPAVKKSYAQMTQKEYEIARRAERKAKGLRD